MANKESADKQKQSARQDPSEQEDKVSLQPNGQIDLDKIKNEFTEVDFHPLEPKPPDKYMYSVNYDNVRHTLNTYLRRPIKKAFASNSKKLVLTVDRRYDKTIDSLFP